MSQLGRTGHRLKTGEMVTIRSADSEDAAQVLAHGQAVIREGTFLVTVAEEFTLTEEQERDWLQQHVDHHAKLALVAEIGDDIVGVLFFEPGERRRLAHRGTLHLSVHQDWRSRGIGALLLQTLIEWAEAHPTVEKLSLGVLATNTTAIRLYRKLGFIEEGCLPREVKLGPDEYVDDLMMYRFV